MAVTRAATSSRLLTRPVLVVGGGGLLVAVVLAVSLLAATGQLAAVTAGLFDPGAVVRYGLPAARAVHDLAAATTVGLLVLAAWCVAPEVQDEHDRVRGVRLQMVQAASVAGAAWLVAGIVVLLFTVADVAGFPLTAPGFGSVVVSFLSQIDLGRALGVSLLLVAVVCALTVVATRIATVAWAAALSLVALLPLALAGHAAGTSNHMNSVDSLALHLLGVCVWTGGLVALLLMARRLGPQLPVVTARYSTLALWCFVVVAVSGVINAGLRLGSWSALASSYGLLVIGKTVALVLLGTAGVLHRRMTIAKLTEARRLFIRLAVVEVLIMSATFGLAVALSRSAPPEAEVAPDPVAALLGYPPPPPLTVGRWFGSFYPEILWLTAALVMIGLYLAGVVKLRRRGDRWPAQRLVFWLVGCLALIFVTSGGPAVYGRMHFSTHMLQHMALMVPVPLLLVFGAPVTLAMRALTARTDGSFGPRELLLRLIHSRVLSFLGQPLVAAVLFTGSLTVFYYSNLFQLAMFTHTGHVLMTAHFLLTGYLFVWSLVGIDPGPKRPPYPFRLVLLLMTLGFHAFFGISLMSSGSVLAPDWWHALGQTDDAALLADQEKGGSIAWAAGDIPSLLLAFALVVGWVRSDARETKRLDRKADRDDDAELKRYNEQLAALSRQDQP
ncbi:MAG: bifunctional copper resistance protein CopD/cytochrome c oxidase assembly protein [Propionibacteriaceae bacterium]